MHQSSTNGQYVNEVTENFIPDDTTAFLIRRYMDCQTKVNPRISISAFYIPVVDQMHRTSDPNEREKMLWDFLKEQEIAGPERARIFKMFRTARDPAPPARSRRIQEEGEYSQLSDQELGVIALDRKSKTKVKYLVKNLLAVGRMTLIGGEGDRGKSQIALSLVASLCGGPPLPMTEVLVREAGVLILAAEDDVHDTIIPRLEAAGADVDRCVKCLEPRVWKETDHGVIVLPKSFQDLDWWGEIFARYPETRLVVADTIPSFMGRGVNDNANNEVRQILETFCRFLGEKGAALLGVVHFNKSVDANTPVNRILGSVAYPNLARVVLTACEDGDNPGRMLLANPKNNLVARQEKPTRAYRIVGVNLTDPEDDEIYETSKVDWEPEAVPLTAGQALMAERAANKRRGPAPTKTLEVAEWLYDYLKAQGQPVPWKTVFMAAGVAGLVGTQGQDGRWSNVNSLYRAVDLFPSLVGPRAGSKVTTLDITDETGYARKHWFLEVGKAGAPDDEEEDDFLQLQEVPF